MCSICRARQPISPVGEQTLSRYVKERTAPASVKVGNGRRFHRNDLGAWVMAGGVLASRRWRTEGYSKISFPH